VRGLERVGEPEVSPFSFPTDRDARREPRRVVDSRLLGFGRLPRRFLARGHVLKRAPCGAAGGSYLGVGCEDATVGGEGEAACPVAPVLHLTD
jgi:hypothetical protein